MARLGRLVGIVAAFLVAGIFARPEAEAQTAGGWACFPGFGRCTIGGFDHEGTTNATVGLSFEWQLQAGCNTGQWNLEGVEIHTGRLPPGLEYDPAQYAIIGVPTRAGSFSFEFLFRGVSCPGSNFRPYEDWTRNYTIIVTGS